MSEITVLGIFVADISFSGNKIPTTGETILGDSYNIGPGGKGCNQAISISRLGGKVNFISKLGNDDYGKLAINKLKKDNIDTSNIIISNKHKTGVAGIHVDRNTGKNAITVVRGAPSTLTTKEIDTNLIKQSKIFLTQLEIPIEVTLHCLKAAKEYGLSVDPKWNWGQVVEEMFAEYVEPTLIQPTHITDFPFEISPLAKTHRTNPRLVERFETFINGWEIANAFTELNDPDVQYERFMDQVAQREDGNDEAQMLDEDYVTALRYGLPPNAGWGLGIDRLTMILTNSHNIRDVICFPTLKPKA